MYSVSCGMPSAYYVKSGQHKFEVNTQQNNLATRLLLRPVVHQHRIQFHCEPPQSSQLHWAQQQANPEPV